MNVAGYSFYNEMKKPFHFPHTTSLFCYSYSLDLYHSAFKKNSWQLYFKDQMAVGANKTSTEMA